MKRKSLAFYNIFLRPFPSGIVMKMRISFLRWCGAKIGNNVRIEEDVVIRGGGALSIGDGTILKAGAIIECSGGTVHIGKNCRINRGSLICANSDSTIYVGDNVQIAHFVSLKGSTHEINRYAEKTSGCIAGRSKFADIVVGDGSWLCAACVILPGVTIGKRNVIAAGAVVLNDTPDNVLMAGVPAKVKKHYQSD